MSDSPGMVTIRVSGRNARRLFANEAGGHRWQRVPPTERGGRVHSSTVTVAVLDAARKLDVQLDERDLEFSTTRGSGPGGQNRNKVETVVVVKHKPSGISVRSESERSQQQNRRVALQILRSKLQQQAASAAKNQRDSTRREQVGTGERSDKIRTVQVQNGTVTNHITGRKCALKTYLKGNIEAVA